MCAPGTALWQEFPDFDACANFGGRYARCHASMQEEYGGDYGYAGSEDHPTYRALSCVEETPEWMSARSMEPSEKFWMGYPDIDENELEEYPYDDDIWTKDCATFEYPDPKDARFAMAFADKGVIPIIIAAAPSNSVVLPGHGDGLHSYDWHALRMSANACPALQHDPWTTYTCNARLFGDAYCFEPDYYTEFFPYEYDYPNWWRNRCNTDECAQEWWNQCMEHEYAHPLEVMNGHGANGYFHHLEYDRVSGAILDKIIHSIEHVVVDLCPTMTPSTTTSGDQSTDTEMQTTVADSSVEEVPSSTSTTTTTTTIAIDESTSDNVTISSDHSQTDTTGTIADSTLNIQTTTTEKSDSTTESYVEGTTEAVVTTETEGQSIEVASTSRTESSVIKCQDLLPVEVDIEWNHIQDGSLSMEQYHEHSLFALSEVSRRLTTLYSGLDVNFTFSMVKAHDKRVVCDKFEEDCTCKVDIVEEMELERLPCFLDPDCSLTMTPLGGKYQYIDIAARPSLFDPLIDISQANYSKMRRARVASRRLDQREKLNVVSILTNQCSRVSATENIIDKESYWRWIPAHLQGRWEKVDSGINSDTGETTSNVCDNRDYPTNLEVAKSLNLSSTGVVVIVAGDGDAECSDISDFRKEEFWVNFGVEASKQNVYNSVNIAPDAAYFADQLYQGVISFLHNSC